MLHKDKPSHRNSQTPIIGCLVMFEVVSLFKCYAISTLERLIFLCNVTLRNDIIDCILIFDKFIDGFFLHLRDIISMYMIYLLFIFTEKYNHIIAKYIISDREIVFLA